jgi:hypothetical protein
MADPKVEKIEKKPEETGAPTGDDELSDRDFENVSGGHNLVGDGAGTGCACDQSCSRT